MLTNQQFSNQKNNIYKNVSFTDEYVHMCVHICACLIYSMKPKLMTDYQVTFFIKIPNRVIYWNYILHDMIQHFLQGSNTPQTQKGFQ